MSRISQVLVVAILIAALASPPLGAQVAETPEAGPPEAPRFDLQSNFWVNLHHVLYYVALLETEPDHYIGEGPDDLDRAASLEGGQKTAWRTAVDHYREELVGRDLLFDRELKRINDSLSRTAADGAPDRSILGAELADVLEAVAPVYRAVWWADHDRANRDWIAHVEPLLESFGQEIGRRIAASYGGTWPDEPIRTDVTVRANRYGGYTSNSPVHITIVSTDSAYRRHALEMLFHEASHFDRIEQPIRGLVARAFAVVDADPPRDLWHLLLFMTAGEVTKDVLEAAGRGPYSPFVHAQGMYERNRRWDRYRRVLEPLWRARLDGELGPDEALEKAARAIHEQETGG